MVKSSTFSCRHEQPQHTCTTTPPASLTLLEVLHHVPMLSQVLSSDARKALSAANRTLRENFVSQIQIVTVTCTEDAALVIKCAWPLLSMVIVQNEYFAGDASGRALAHVSVSGAALSSHAAILMLRPRHTHASASAGWPTLAAQQLASQVTVKFPKLRRFEFSATFSRASTAKVDLAALSLATIAQITKCHWSSLGVLTFAECGLDSQGLSLLIQGDWPLLQSLDVSRNHIDAEGMALLAKGNWPMLTHIELNYNPSIIYAVGIEHLSAANWPLQKLELCGAPVTAATAAELAKLQLPKLDSISLRCAGLTAAAISGLAEAHWPCLSHLDLSGNILDAAAMQHLLKMQLPALKGLSLSDANITDRGAYWLSLGHWPLLKDFDLSCNNLYAKGVEHIVSGIWPNLQYLWLHRNLIGDSGVQHLIKGDWPLLHFLSIEHSMLTAPHSAVCLGLDPARLHDSGLVHWVSRSTVGLWPNLSEVEVWSNSVISFGHSDFD